MTEVVFEIADLSCVAQFVFDRDRKRESAGEPFRHGPLKRRPRKRPAQEMIRDHARELQEWFFEVGDVIDLIDRDSGVLQAKANGVNRKLARVFDTTEALFLRGRDDFAIVNEARR